MMEEYDSVKWRFAVVKNACNTRNLTAENNLDNELNKHNTHDRILFNEPSSPSSMLE